MSKEIDYGADEVPVQEIGSEMNVVEYRSVDSAKAATDLYSKVKARLLDVNNWGDVAKLPISTFRLLSEAAVRVDRPARKGDYIRIDVPGPGTHAGEGYDWVKIEYINEQVDEGRAALTMIVRPSPNPLNNDPNVAHFLKDSATSTFQVKRIGNRVFVEEHARNEVANNHTGSTFDNIRNTLVGWSAKIGFSYPQWKGLVKGLID